MQTVCSKPKLFLLVLLRRHYLVNATKFDVPCASNLIVLVFLLENMNKLVLINQFYPRLIKVVNPLTGLQIDGKLVVPNKPMNWDPKLSKTWLDFSKQGHGVIDWKQLVERILQKEQVKCKHNI